MLNGRILLMTMFAIGAIAALLGLVQMWTHAIEWVLFGKIMVTLGIVGVLAGVLMAVDFDLNATNTKRLLLALIAILIAGAALVLDQIWLHIISFSLFWKLGGTLVIIGGFISFIIAVHEDFSLHKKLKDEKYLD